MGQKGVLAVLVAPCTSSLYKQGSRPESSIAVDPSDSLGYLLALLSVVQTSLVKVLFVGSIGSL